MLVAACLTTSSGFFGSIGEGEEGDCGVDEKADACFTTAITKTTSLSIHAIELAMGGGGGCGRDGDEGWG